MIKVAQKVHGSERSSDRNIIQLVINPTHSHTFKSAMGAFSLLYSQPFSSSPLSLSKSMSMLIFIAGLITALSAQSISYDSAFCTSFLENNSSESMKPKYVKVNFA